MVSVNRFHSSARTTNLPRWYLKNPPIDTTLLIKTYLGIVRDPRDPQNMGRLLVWIPELSGDADEPENWIVCAYCSPFAGATYFEIDFYHDGQSDPADTRADPIRENKDRAQEVPGDPKRMPRKFPGQFSGRQSYGMWFVPPDIGNEVLITFLHGDPNMAVWFGCLYQQDMNHMIPGIASNEVFVDENTPSSEEGPVIETDLEVDAPQGKISDARRLAYRPLRDGLKIRQGLDRDVLRGQSTSTARRESPSEVFGILTPDGSHFVMDDNPTNEFIRIRTKSGAQLLIHQSEGFIYAITKNGRTWIELNDEGHVDIYAMDSISVHAEKGNVNIKAGLGSINIQAAQDINMVAGKNIKIIAGENIDILSNRSTRIKANQTMNISSDDDFAINSGSEIGITAAGNIKEEAKNIFMNSGQGPQADVPIEPDSPKVTGPTQPPEVSGTGLWEPGAVYPENSNIIPRVPQHEPWTGHKSKTQGTNRSIPESPRNPNILTGAAEENSLFPLDIISPDGTILNGVRFNNVGLPEYVEIGKVAAGSISPIGTLEISQNGLNLIKQFEGIENQVYNDVAGNATIGVGHLITAADKEAGKFKDGFISNVEIDEVLRSDLQSTQAAVRGCVNQPLTNDQYDALVSLAFNVGNTAFCNSTLVKKINEEKYEEVPNEFQRWNKVRVGGILQDSQGLTNRRVTEARLFAKIPTV